jgi:hypothetical protein
MIAPAELLEKRLMLSISTAPFVDPRMVPGTTWVYQYTVNTGQTGMSSQTVVGPATFNGSNATEIDTIVGGNVIDQDYFGTAPDGSSVDLGFNSSNANSSSIRQTTIYSPYRGGFPTTISAGVPYTSSDVETDTTYDSLGNPSTSTTDETATLMLVSETPTLMTFGSHTYETYETTETRTDTPVPASLGSPSTTVNTQYFVPDVGLVEDVSAGITYKLTSFNEPTDHLSFPPTQIATTPSGKTLPPVVVSVLDQNNNPDMNASGRTVTLTLQSASRLNTSTGTLGGTLEQTVVGYQATFSDLTVSADGTYTLTATDSNDDTLAISKRFKIGIASLQVEIISKAPGGAKGVKSGDEIQYSILVHPKKTLSSQVFILTLQPGFVPNSIDGGGVYSGNLSTGNTITWTNNVTAMNFSLKVPDAKTLASLGGIKSVLVSADDNVVYVDGTTDEGTATNSVKLASSYEVDGKVYDAIFRFPQIGKVVTSAPLSGVYVSLVDSTGVTVDTTKTAGNGKFTLTAKAAGSYEILFSKLAGMYSSASNSSTDTSMYLSTNVTFEVGNTTPMDLGNLVMPKTFLDTSATILKSLNNYNTSYFGSLQATTFALFQFDTTGAESALSGLAGTEANPGNFMDAMALRPGQPTDPWVAAIRMMTGLYEVNQRFKDMFKIVDTTARAMSVVMCVGFVKQLQSEIAADNKARGVPFTPAPPEQSIAQGARVGLFTTSGEAIFSGAFDYAISLLPVSASVKAQISSYKAALITTFFTGIRFGYDLLTNTKLLDDGVFEALFNPLRIGLDEILLSSLAGASVRADIPLGIRAILAAPEIAGAIGAHLDSATSLQAVIDSCVNNRLVYDTGTDTDDVLDSVEFFDDQAHQAHLLTLSLVQDFSNLSSVLRGIDGVGFLLSKGSTALDPSTATGVAQYFIKSAASATSKFLDNAEVNLSIYSRIPVNSALKSYAAVGITPALASGCVGFLYQLYWGSLIANLALTGSTGTDATSSVNMPDAAPPFTAAPAPVLAPSPVAASQESSSLRTTAAASITAPADASAFLSDLTQLSALVKAKNITAIGALLPQYTADEQTLFSGDLIALDDHAQAALPQLSIAANHTATTFDSDLSLAINSVTYASEQLDAWSSSPATGIASLVTSQFSTTISAVQTAVKDAASVRPLIAGVSLPASLNIVETAVPSQATAGSSQTFTFTVTNIGSQPTSPGTISFINSDGSMILSSQAQQDLPALAAGASASFTWTADILTPPNPDFGSAYQVQAVAGDVEASVTDQINITG